MDLQIPKKLKFLVSTQKRYKVAYGGRGAGKSWAYADCLLARSIQRPHRILCTRELQNSIRDSVYRLLVDRINYHKLQKCFIITDTEIRTVPREGHSGSLFIFKGLRSHAEEIKSLEAIDICWVEEARKVASKSWDILIPTIRQEGSEIWISFNTGNERDPVYERFVKIRRHNAVVQKVNYYDNPWFPNVLRADMEWDKENNPLRYNNVWLGEIGADGTFFVEFGDHLKEKAFDIERSALEGRLIGSLDSGTTHATSFGLWWLAPDYVIHRLGSYWAEGLSVGEHARAVYDRIESFLPTMGFFPEKIFADPSMWTKVKKNEYDTWKPIEEYEKLFTEKHKNTSFVPANNDKVNGCQVMKQLFKDIPEAPEMRYFEEYNKSFEDGLKYVETDENDREKYAKMEGDDAADEARYGLMACYSIIASFRQGEKMKKLPTPLERLLKKSKAKQVEDWYNG
jgi:hypothetical protein